MARDPNFVVKYSSYLETAIKLVLYILKQLFFVLCSEEPGAERPNEPTSQFSSGPVSWESRYFIYVSYYLPGKIVPANYQRLFKGSGKHAQWSTAQLKREPNAPYLTVFVLKKIGKSTSSAL